MPHAYRFHVPIDTAIAGTIALPPDEAHHAARVVRVRPGDSVELFDGAGHVWPAVVEDVSKRDVHVCVLEAHAIESPTMHLTLLQAWPNHEKTAESIIRRATELGVTELVFFRGEHSERAPKQTDKWDKIAIESAKQCRCAWLPRIGVQKNLSEALEVCPREIVVGATAGVPVPVATVSAIDALALVIGPEGDLSERELGLLLERGARPISLGAIILRCEIAVTVAIALIQYERGQLGPKAWGHRPPEGTPGR